MQINETGFRQIVEQLKKEAEERFKKAAPTSWQEDEAMGEIKMAKRILEKLG